MNNTIDRGTIFNSFVKPFIDIIPFILSNPLSKRLPKGFRVNRQGKRNFNTSIMIYCIKFQALTEGYNHLILKITEEENKKIEEVFILRDKLIEEGKI